MCVQYNSGGEEESGMLDGENWFSKLVRKKFRDF
jgi:hypothetical protein